MGLTPGMAILLFQELKDLIPVHTDDPFDSGEQALQGLDVPDLLPRKMHIDHVRSELSDQAPDLDKPDGELDQHKTGNGKFPEGMNFSNEVMKPVSGYRDFIDQFVPGKRFRYPVGQNADIITFFLQTTSQLRYNSLQSPHYR